MDLDRFLLKQFKPDNSSTAYITFGTFNPPTTATMLPVLEAHALAIANDATERVFVATQQQSLPFDFRAKLLEECLPTIQIEQSNQVHTYASFRNALTLLHKDGIRKVNVLVFENQAEQYDAFVAEYLDCAPAKMFESIEIIYVQETSDETIVCAAARSNYSHTVKRSLPPALVEQYADEIQQRLRGEEVVVQLDEGVYDPSTFKAIFLFGGAGSGKDFVLSKALAGGKNSTISGLGLTELNSDHAYEYLLKKNKLDFKMPDSEEPQRNIVRDKAKTVADARMLHAFAGRRGIIINGTGEKHAKTVSMHKRLKELGYDSLALFVTTSDNVSRQRNLMRGERGGRQVPEEIRKAKWQGAMKAKEEIRTLFGSENYLEFDNDADLRNATPELKKQKEGELFAIYKKAAKFVAKKPTNSAAKDWIEKELHTKHGGNPYHDKSGQFTDKQHATTTVESAFIRYKKKHAH